jgi:hypothetical protein
MKYRENPFRTLPFLWKLSLCLINFSTCMLTKKKEKKQPTKDRTVKQILPRDGYQWKGEGHKEKMKEGKYGVYILYSCMKTEQ